MSQTSNEALERYENEKALEEKYKAKKAKNKKIHHYRIPKIYKIIAFWILAVVITACAVVVPIISVKHATHWGDNGVNTNPNFEVKIDKKGK